MLRSKAWFLDVSDSSRPRLKLRRSVPRGGFSGEAVASRLSPALRQLDDEIISRQKVQKTTAIELRLVVSNSREYSYAIADIRICRTHDQYKVQSFNAKLLVCQGESSAYRSTARHQNAQKLRTEVLHRIDLSFWGYVKLSSRPSRKKRSHENRIPPLDAQVPSDSPTYTASMPSVICPTKPLDRVASPPPPIPSSSVY